MKSPMGSKESPARSCLDLLLENPNIEDGLYWIDPNGGCSNDAVEVHCNFTEGVARTCISPAQNEVERKIWSGDSIWFSSLQGGFELAYDIPKSQLEFMRAGARRATQTFTYRCRRSAAAVVFRTQNGKEITASKVIYDGCQSRPSVPDVSVLEVNTKRVEQLPLSDFASADIGGHTAEFGFEMGPACFY